MTYSRIQKQVKFIYSENTLPPTLSQSFYPEAAVTARFLYHLCYTHTCMRHSASTCFSSNPCTTIKITIDMVLYFFHLIYLEDVFI